jgi:hypothetical protein
MRKPKTAFVRRGNLYGEGATKREAKAAIERQLDRAAELPSPTVETRFGLVLVLVADPTGWQSTIVDPTESKHGDQRQCWSCFGPVDKEHALSGLRLHAAQRTWTPDVDDSVHIAAAGLNDRHESEFRYWIKFQRDYIAGRSMLVDVVAADTGIVEHISVSLVSTIGDDSHELARAAAEIASHGRALIGGGAAPAFYLVAA